MSKKENPGSTLRTFAWIGLGLTVVGGLGGLAAYLVAKRREKDKEEGTEEPEREAEELRFAGTPVQTVPATEPPPARIEVAQL